MQQKHMRESSAGGRRASWRPRFTIRTLVVLLTVVCVYLATWEATQKFGVLPNSTQRAPMPFIITDESTPHFKKSVDGSPLTMECERTYYAWCFGQHELVASQVVRTFPRLNSRREQNEAIREHVLQRREQKLRNQERANKGK